MHNEEGYNAGIIIRKNFSMRDKSIARGIESLNKKSQQRRILHQVFKEQTAAQASEQ